MTFYSGQNAQRKCYTWEGLEFLNISQFMRVGGIFIVIPILDLTLSFLVSCDKKIHATDFDHPSKI